MKCVTSSRIFSVGTLDGAAMTLSGLATLADHEFGLKELCCYKSANDSRKTQGESAGFGVN